MEGAPAAPDLNSMLRMFAKEAAAQGIDVRIMPSSADLAVAPLALTRIKSNLVHNAIRHSKASKTVLGLRRTVADRACIQILGNSIGYSLPAASKRAQNLS